jgi:hypothetical protein
MKNQPKAKRTGHTAPRKRQERPAPAEAAKQTTSTKRAPKAAQSAKASQPKSAARESKRAAVLVLLQREGGASLDEVMAATGWQRHSARGFLSILGSKGGHQITAAARKDGVRTYTTK